MSPANSCGLFSILEQVDDPRGRQGQRHPFSAMLATIICATLCGVRGFKPIAQWIRSQEVSTCHWFGFKRKPPCANSFNDLLKLIDPEQLEHVILQWTQTLDGIEINDESLRAVSIDGKTLCGTLQAHQRSVHLLAAFDHQTGYALSQTCMDSKTNEAKTALVLLKSLVLKGKVIVGDAMFCQREICEEVLDSGGDYFFAVKDNQPTLRKEIELAFANSEGFSPLPTS